MNKILVAVDFSEHTDISCNYAIEIAKINKAEVCLFHACFDKVLTSASGISDTYGINAFINPELNTEIENSANKQMLTLKNKLISNLQNENISGISVNSIITNGDFETDLNTICDDYHPSIVIIGTKGKDQSLNIFGDTANKVIDNLRFPVLAIPEINNYSGIKNIMYAADIHASDHVLIRKTYNLLENSDVNMFCVYIVEKSEYLRAYSKIDELKIVFEKEITEEKLHFDVLEANDKQIEIDRFVKKNNIDLIVFLPHKTNVFQRLFGQNSPKKYFFETNLPLLTIRL